MLSEIFICSLITLLSVLGYMILHRLGHVHDTVIVKDHVLAKHAKKSKNLLRI